MNIVLMAALFFGLPQSSATGQSLGQQNWSQYDWGSPERAKAMHAHVMMEILASSQLSESNAWVRKRATDNEIFTRERQNRRATQIAKGPDGIQEISQARRAHKLAELVWLSSLFLYDEELRLFRNGLENIKQDYPTLDELRSMSEQDFSDYSGTIVKPKTPKADKMRNDAMNRFRLLVGEYPNLKQRDQLLYLLWHHYSLIDDRVRAHTTALDLFENFPQSNFAKAAHLGRAETALRNGDLEVARNGFKRALGKLKAAARAQPAASTIGKAGLGKKSPKCSSLRGDSRRRCRKAKAKARAKRRRSSNRFGFQKLKPDRANQILAQYGLCRINLSQQHFRKASQCYAGLIKDIAEFKDGLSPWDLETVSGSSTKRKFRAFKIARTMLRQERRRRAELFRRQKAEELRLRKLEERRKQEAARAAALRREQAQRAIEAARQKAAQKAAEQKCTREDQCAKCLNIVGRRTRISTPWGTTFGALQLCYNDGKRQEHFVRDTLNRCADAVVSSHKRCMANLPDMGNLRGRVIKKCRREAIWDAVYDGHGFQDSNCVYGAKGLNNMPKKNPLTGSLEFPIWD